MKQPPLKPTMESTITLNLLAATSGVLTHIAIFRRGEWDVASPSVFVFYSTVFAAAALLSYSNFVSAPLSAIVQMAGSHVAALYSSMLVYRAFFHRLSKYPGPFLARLTNFYITALSVKRLHLFKEVQQLHQQYGDFVRLGECFQWFNGAFSCRLTNLFCSAT